MKNLRFGLATIILLVFVVAFLLIPFNTKSFAVDCYAPGGAPYVVNMSSLCEDVSFSNYQNTSVPCTVTFSFPVFIQTSCPNSNFEDVYPLRSASNVNLPSFIPPGTYTITNTNPCCSYVVNIVVDVQWTQTVVSLNPTTVNTGGQTTVTATVSDIISNNINPTGSVIFNDGASSAGGSFGAVTCNPSGNNLVCTAIYTASQTAGSVTINAQYYPPNWGKPTTNLSPSSGTASLSVNPSLQTSSTSVSAESNEIFPGGQTLVTAWITGQFGFPNPTGPVTFNDGGAGGTFGTTTCVPSGNFQLECTVTYTASQTAGSVTITANYGGDSTYQKSSGTSTLTVNSLHTSSTSVLLGFNPILIGGQTTVTALVDGYTDAPIPTGSVTFNDGGAGGTFGTTTCLPNNVHLVCDVTYTASLTAASITITANYGGNSIYQASSGTNTLFVDAPVSATLGQYKGDVKISHSGGPFKPVTPGQILSPGDELQTGANGNAVISFNDGSSKIEVGASTNLIYTSQDEQTLLQGILWTFENFVCGGCHVIHITQGYVSVRGTDFVATSDQNSQTSTIYLEQGAVAIPPTATNSYNAPSILTINNVGVVSSSSLSQNTWNAETSKFAFVAGSISTTTLTSSLNPSVFGQSVTFTAKVSPTSATGTVTFSIDGTAQSPVTVSSGTAALSTSSLSLGSHQITAAYSGDTNDLPSTSSTLTQTVKTSSISFTTIDDPNGVGTTIANGINNNGQIVGQYSSGGLSTTYPSHGFLYSITAGTFTTIDNPKTLGPDPGTWLHSINDAGEIIGTHGGVALGVEQGFYSKSPYSSFTETHYPGAYRGATDALGLNNAGQVVGQYEFPSVSQSPVHGYKLSHGVYASIGGPSGYSFAAGYGINKAGQIVGTYAVNSGPFHGFLDNSGTFTTIDPPGTTSTWAYGTNDNGQIVGQYTDSSSKTHGFLYSSGVYTTIDVPGATFTSAHGINNAGQIVGQYSDSSGATHGFLMTS